MTDDMTHREACGLRFHQPLETLKVFRFHDQIQCAVKIL